jgi:AcrR family transcriptional regulator
MRPKRRPTGRQAPSFIEAARRAQIIAAATETLADRGYAEASLAAIAVRAGITKSIISYHFTDKADLLEQVVAQIYGDIWSYIEPRLAAAPTAAGRLRAYIEAEFGYLESHRAQLLAVGQVLANHRDRAGRLFLLEQAAATVVGFVSKILEAGQRTGEFRVFDPRLMAVTIHHALNGALHYWVTCPGLSLHAYAEELVTLFARATARNPRLKPPLRP